MYCCNFERAFVRLLGLYNPRFACFLLFHHNVANILRGASGLCSGLCRDSPLLHLSECQLSDICANQAKTEERREELVESPVDPVFQDECLKSDEGEEEGERGRGRRLNLEVWQNLATLKVKEG